MSTKIRGKVFSGLGQGSSFTRLDWVKEQCSQKMGFVPYPGTLNLKVDRRYLSIAKKLRERETSIKLEPPSSEFCEAKSYPVSLGKISAAIVIPMVDGYPLDVIELVAPVNIRQALSLADGDRLSLTIKENAEL